MLKIKKIDNIDLLIASFFLLGVPVVYEELKVSDIFLVMILISLFFSKIYFFFRDVVKKIIFLYFILLGCGLLGLMSSVFKGLVDDQYIYNYAVIEGKRLEYFMFFVLATLYGRMLGKEDLENKIKLIYVLYFFVGIWAFYYYSSGLYLEVGGSGRLDFPFIVRGGQNLGIALALLLPFMMAYCLSAKNKKILLITIVISAIFILLGGGRAGVVCFLTTILVYFIYLNKKINILFVFLFSSLFVYGLYSAFLEEFDTSLRIFRSWHDASASARIQNFNYAISLWDESYFFPFLGTGPGVVQLLDLYWVHFLINYGLLGFSVYMLILFFIFNAAGFLKKTSSFPGDLKYYRIAIISSLAGYVVSGIVSESIFTDRVSVPFWLILGLVFGYVINTQTNYKKYY